MGRIKITQVKKSGRKLYNDYSDKFKADFRHNKKELGKFAEIRSKQIKNAVAGYITKLKKLNAK